MKTNIVPMQIGQIIRQIREARGSTLEEIALAANTNASNLSRIERGRQGYSPETIEKIAFALDVSVSELHRRLESQHEGPVCATDMAATSLTDRFRLLTPDNQALVEDFLSLLLRRQRGTQRSQVR
jgi:transcriptional regulator with XRE-family HTH domain